MKRSRAALTEGSLSWTYNRAKAFKTPSAEQGRQRGGTFPSFQRDFFLAFAFFFLFFLKRTIEKAIKEGFFFPHTFLGSPESGERRKSFIHVSK